VVFAGIGAPVDCPVYERSRLSTGAAISGPAIIEDHESTTGRPARGTLRGRRAAHAVIALKG
jgi:N-methylhydantoinase A/oxoprolinase/acetone carboxylase beta subunit